MCCMQSMLSDGVCCMQNMVSDSVCCVQNMVGPGEVDEDLEPETAEECSKYGKVTKVVIYEVGCTIGLLLVICVYMFYEASAYTAVQAQCRNPSGKRAHMQLVRDGSSSHLCLLSHCGLITVVAGFR